MILEKTFDAFATDDDGAVTINYGEIKAIFDTEEPESLCIILPQSFDNLVIGCDTTDMKRTIDEACKWCTSECVDVICTAIREVFDSFSQECLNRKIHTLSMKPSMVN